MQYRCALKEVVERKAIVGQGLRIGGMLICVCVHFWILDIAAWYIPHTGGYVTGSTNAVVGRVGVGKSADGKRKFSVLGKVYCDS